MIDNTKVEFTAEQAQRVLDMLDRYTAVQSLTDRELADRFLTEVWAKMSGNQDFLADELLGRFEHLAGIIRDNETGEIVSGGEDRTLTQRELNQLNLEMARIAEEQRAAESQ